MVSESDFLWMWLTKRRTEVDVGMSGVVLGSDFFANPFTAHRLTLTAFFMTILLVLSAPAFGKTEEGTALSPQELIQYTLTFELERRDVEFRLEVPELKVGREERFDIPIVLNDRVEYYLDYFQTRKKDFFSRSLVRAGRYLAMMKEIFRRGGIPEDLVYLALIESGFSINAYSRARALGIWQFLVSTARRYGLRVDRWVDERKDPEKATIAAASYLKDLYQMFNSWHLALAAYNAGEKKILAAISRYKTEDFWELRDKPFLKRETKEFVPKMLAATLMAKEPEKYGFEGIRHQEPEDTAMVDVPPRTPLWLVARSIGVSLRDVKALNPALLRGITPPGYSYSVRIPADKVTLFKKRLHLLLAEYKEEQAKEAKRGKGSSKISSKRYRVRRGDTLEEIARRHGVSVQTLARANGIKNPRRLPAGRVIIIPRNFTTAARTKGGAG